MEEMQCLNKQIDFNNLTYKYEYKGKFAPKIFLAFKGPLGFYENKKEGYIILEKAEEIRKEFKSEINEIVKGKNKSEEQKSAINNI